MPEEKKSYYNESQNKATQRYLEKNMEAVRFWARKGEKDRYKAAAAACNMSMAAFITAAINEKIQREGLEAGQEVQEAHPEDPTEAGPEDRQEVSQGKGKPVTVPFTEEERAKVDLARLQHDVLYQFTIRDAYGEKVLTSLMEEARKEK